MNEWVIAYEWVMASQSRDSVRYINEACHICECVMCQYMKESSHMNESWRHSLEILRHIWISHGWVMPHVWISHITRMNESWLHSFKIPASRWIHMRRLIHTCDMTHPWRIHMCNTTHSWLIHTYDMTHPWRIHMIRLIHMCDMTHPWLIHMSHTYLGHNWGEVAAALHQIPFDPPQNAPVGLHINIYAQIHLEDTFGRCQFPIKFVMLNDYRSNFWECSFCIDPSQKASVGLHTMICAQIHITFAQIHLEDTFCKSQLAPKLEMKQLYSWLLRTCFPRRSVPECTGRLPSQHRCADSFWWHISQQPPCY